MTDENYDEMIDSMRADGCDAWDDVEDVDEELREIRGEQRLGEIVADGLREFADDLDREQAAVLDEARAILEIHPSKDARMFARSVLEAFGNQPTTKGGNDD